jgi:ankyrin repeat protein
MIVLAPCCKHADLDVTCSFGSWRTRGWCRMELMAAVLAQHRIPIIISEGANANPYMLLGLDMVSLCPGEGSFACCGLNHEVAGKKIGCDKHKVRSVLEVMIRSKAQGFLEQGDMLRYRYWTCAKSTFLRGLPGVQQDAKGAEALRSLLKWTEADEKQGLEDGWTLLHWACLADDKVAVEELCAGKPKEYVDMPNKVTVPELLFFPDVTPLIVAMSYASYDVVDALIKAGADPMYTTTKYDSWGQQTSQGLAEDAIMFAALNRKFDNVNQFLKNVPEFPLTRARPGCQSTVVHVAASQGCPAEVYDMLMQNGAEFCKANKMGFNALQNLSFSKDADAEVIRKHVLATKCDVNEVCYPTSLFFKTFFFPMRAKYYTSGAKAMNKMELMFAVADGCTALHMAAMNGNVQAVKTLLELGADKTIRNTMGCTPAGVAKAAFGEVPPPLVELLGDAEGSGMCCANHASKNEMVLPATLSAGDVHATPA